MLSIKEAKEIVAEKMPNSTVGKYIEHGDYYIFMLLLTAGVESGFDPFFSVHRKTGEFMDFSVIDSPDMLQIEKKFMESE